LAVVGVLIAALERRVEEGEVGTEMFGDFGLSRRGLEGVRVAER
jgi:hypothetical protein